MRVLLSFVAVLALACQVRAELSLPAVFGDHMVLQRDANIRIWGTADAGESVEVAFADQIATSKVDEKGNWSVELKPLSASKQAQALTIKSGDQTRKITDVLVGDVWVGSGQSNMAGKVGSYAKRDETLAALVSKAPYPMIRLTMGNSPKWGVADKDAVTGFSAIHFAFGERLQRELDVPVGLIVGAVGGTPSGYWIPSEVYAESDLCKSKIAEFAKGYDHAAAMKQYEDRIARLEAAAKKNPQPKKRKARKPQPPKKPGESSRGGKIGGLYQQHISKVVGFRIRGVLWDQGEARSGVVGVDQHSMMTELIRGWRENWNQGEFPFLFVQKPSGGGTTILTNDPITRNAGKFKAALPKANDNAGEQRFLYVRLMNDNANAWMVPASDLGSGIHPTNKWGYGNRAAEIALSQVYKTGVQAYGPVYKSHSVNGDKVTVHFDQIGKGLVAAHDQNLQGFALAGADNQWHWADAKIEGDTVVLTSDKVAKPTQIRYAYSAKIEWANLFNKDGFPALVFEATD